MLSLKGAPERECKMTTICLGEFAHLKLPTIVLACKSDLPLHVDPKRAARVLQQYDVGLIEVATTNPAGKDKIRTAFEWIFKAIFHELRTCCLT